MSRIFGLHNKLFCKVDKKNNAMKSSNNKQDFANKINTISIIKNWVSCLLLQKQGFKNLVIIIISMRKRYKIVISYR